MYLDLRGRKMKERKDADGVVNTRKTKEGYEAGRPYGWKCRSARFNPFQILFPRNGHEEGVCTVGYVFFGVAVRTTPSFFSILFWAGT